MASDRDAIVKKVRLISRKVSTNEVSDADIIEYINTFILYDFPEIHRLFNFRRTFSFYTSPNIDTYYTNTANVNDPMFNFKNAIITTHDPMYVAGYRTYFTQSRENFFNYWPPLQQQLSIGTGDGVTTNFTGTFTDIPVTPRAVLFSSVDATGVAQQLIDVPLVSAVAGQLGTELNNGNTYDPRGVVPAAPTVPVANNVVNYVTGVFDVTFTVAPDTGEDVTVQIDPYTAARPTSILYFNDTFTLRPIPDDSYEVKIEAYVRPVSLDSGTQEPELEQFWQFIAYGAAIKLLQDQTDFDTVQQLFPEFERQKLFVLRTTLVQMDNERSATIYESQSGLNASPFGWWWSNY